MVTYHIQENFFYLIFMRIQTILILTPLKISEMGW